MTFLSVVNENAGAAAWAALFAALVMTALLIALLVRVRRQERENEEIKTALARLRESADEREKRQADYAHNLYTALSRQQEALRQSVTEQMMHMDRTQESALRGNEERMERMRAGLEGIRRENEQQLAEIRRTVDEKLNETLDRRLGESFEQVSRRLEQVAQGLGEMRSLAGGVGDLKKMLSNVKTRGIWGETQLGILLEQMLAPEQYLADTPTVPGSRERVEFAVVLPGQGAGHVLLPIDSKFPLEDYVRMQAAYDSGDKRALDESRAALERRMTAEAKRIQKYIAPPGTTDFAIMFLPLEGLYAEVLHIPGLAEELQNRYRITVAGPTTLCALLTALQTGFRTLAIEQRSGEVWRLLAGFKKEFAAFAQTLERSQQKLQEASESLDAAGKQTGTIQRKLRDVEMPSLPDENE